MFKKVVYLDNSNIMNPKNYPKFLWFKIFSLLDDKDRSSAASACKAWFDLIKGERLLERKASQKLFREIPIEVWKIIFTYLGVRSRLNFGKTYKLWQPVANDEAIWKEKLEEYEGYSFPTIQMLGESYPSLTAKKKVAKQVYLRWCFNAISINDEMLSSQKWYLYERKENKWYLR